MGQSTINHLFDFFECSKNPEKHCLLSELCDVIYLIWKDKNDSYHSTHTTTELANLVKDT